MKRNIENEVISWQEEMKNKYPQHSDIFDMSTDELDAIFAPKQERTEENAQAQPILPQAAVGATAG